jgi:hypothetical protein
MTEKTPPPYDQDNDGQFPSPEQPEQLGPENTTGQPPAQLEQSDGLSRREFFIRAGGGVAATVITGAAITGGVYEGYELFEEYEGKKAAQELFETTLRGSHKLSYFDGLLQIDWSTPMADGMFADAHPAPDISLNNDNFLVAVRPINVINTLLRNVADQDGNFQDRVDRVLHEVPPGLFAFYWPGNETSLTYLDTDAHQDLISPLTGAENFDGKTLPVYNLDIDGREIVDGVVYPYTTGSRVGPAGLPMPTRQIIGNSVYVDNSADLNNLVGNFYAGIEPIDPLECLPKQELI